MKKNYVSRVVLLLLFSVLLISCGYNLNGPIIWYTIGTEGYVRSLLTIEKGPVPLQNTIQNYDIIGGSAAKSSWAFIACHLIYELPESIKKDLEQYSPAENKNSRLNYSEIIFDKDIKINTLKINEDDRLYGKCMLESKKQLLANFKNLVQVNPLDHHLSIYRIRFENNSLFFDIGPYTDDNLYKGFKTLIEMRIGFRYSNSNQVFYGRNKITNFDIGDASINSFHDALILQDLKGKEPVDFKYVSLPYTVTFNKGADRCEIRDKQIQITCESKRGIIIIARLLAKYRDYRRSGIILLVGKKWIKADEARSNIKDLNAPLVELHLETAEIK